MKESAKCHCVGCIPSKRVETADARGLYLEECTTSKVALKLGGELLLPSSSSKKLGTRLALVRNDLETASKFWGACWREDIYIYILGE